ncbi:MAG: hypothetical protein WCG95_09095 [bacterium]
MKSKKKIKIPKPNQLDNMKSWLSFYEEKEKLPHKEIFCGNCKIKKVHLGNAAIKKLLLDTENYPSVKDVLEKTHCKMCRKFERQNQKFLEKKMKSETEEYVPKPTKFLSRQELEEKSEKIRAELPVVNINRPIRTIYLQRNREACEKETRDNCIRPDIFLVNRDCDMCKLRKFCICRIKKFSKYYQG